MITEKELNIANTSYTKKDFYQIYPEILDLVTKITERWNPETSNESDPGVVLLKLLAFIADKNNYNIDKNILECFMPSCTQEESMRKLCAMMGYEMSYNTSAETTISFMWLGDSSSSDATFTLPRFTTTIQSAEGDVTYTLIEKDLTFDNDDIDKTVTCEAIEGEVIKLTVNDSDVITLDNIDSNNRIYLPESSVAQNGIFVSYANTNKSEREWNKVSNLNTIEADSLCWKFGYDSTKELPYIEFSDNIAQLIEDGLTIWYTRTSGANGNVSANVLTKLTSTAEFTDDNSTVNIITDSADGTVNLIISNKASTVNGADKETLDEAYNNFKKTVGTFDTLVTCRDYANAIYNMVVSDTDSTPLVSNCQVSDIKTDVFRASRVKSFNSFGDIYFDYPEISTADNKPIIDNFTLYLYPLKKLANTYNVQTYNQSFTPDTANIYDIQTRLEDNKTISHSFKKAEDDDLYLIKSLYKLQAKITTTYKVDTSEATDILNNVYTALFKNFNAHKVDYGKEIAFDSLLEVIKDADSRIKNVVLDEPELETRFLEANGTELTAADPAVDGDLRTYDKVYVKMLAKNILAGRLPLFKYDTSFKSSFNRKAISDKQIAGDDSDETKKIASLQTKFEFKPSSNPYTLKDNEVIQFRSPSLRTAITYPYNVNYYFDFANKETKISANEEYLLQQNDVLYINYSETDDETDTTTVYNIKYYMDTDKKYKESINGTVSSFEFSGLIKPNFEVIDSSKAEYYGKKSGWDSSWTVIEKGMVTLGAKEQIDIRAFVSVTFGSGSDLKINKFCWITNNTIKTDKEHKCYLFDENTNEKVLSEGEYLFYTNDAENELYTLGSGTLIKTSLSAEAAKNKYVIDLSIKDQPSVDDVANNGLSAFSDVAWNIINFDSNETLKCQEMQYVTLTSGDQITSINGLDSTVTQLDNSYKSLNPNSGTAAEYVMSGSAGKLTILPNSDDLRWAVRSRFDLNCSSDNTQKIYSDCSLIAKNSSGTELLSLTGSDTDTPAIISNYALSKEGSDYIPATVYSVTGKEINTLKILPFSEDTSGTQSISLNNFDSSHTSIDIADITENTALNIMIPQTSEYAIMMLYYTKGDETSVKLVSDKNSSIIQYEVYTTDSSPTWYKELNLKQGLNTILIKKSSTLTFTIDKSSSTTLGNLIISDYSIIPSSNYGVDVNLLNIADSEDKLKYLLRLITTYSQTNFYYNSTLKSNYLIDVGTKIDDHFWYDSNNVCSKFVLPQIDTDSLENIMIAKQSRTF